MSENDNSKENSKEISVWIEEYKNLNSDIMKRIELQHKNLSLHLVVLSAIAGYLFNYGIKSSFTALVNKELLILVAVAPLISQIFIWRHINHDFNIINKAKYIEVILSKNVNRLLNKHCLLGFERYLHRSRLKQLKSVDFFVLLGIDYAITITYTILYLILGWYICIKFPLYAGSLKSIFLYLLIMDTILIVITILMVYRSVLYYINLVDIQGKEDL